MFRRVGNDDRAQDANRDHRDEAVAPAPFLFRPLDGAVACSAAFAWPHSACAETAKATSHVSFIPVDFRASRSSRRPSRRNHIQAATTRPIMFQPFACAPAVATPAAGLPSIFVFKPVDVATAPICSAKFSWFAPTAVALSAAAATDEFGQLLFPWPGLAPRDPLPNIVDFSYDGSMFSNSEKTERWLPPGHFIPYYELLTEVEISGPAWDDWSDLSVDLVDGAAFPTTDPQVAVFYLKKHVSYLKESIAKRELEIRPTKMTFEWLEGVRWNERAKAIAVDALAKTTEQLESLYTKQTRMKKWTKEWNDLDNDQGFNDSSFRFFFDEDCDENLVRSQAHMVERTDPRHEDNSKVEAEQATVCVSRMRKLHLS